jgi:hypothetical protein
MPLPRTFLVVSGIYLAACIFVLVTTEPWSGGEGGIVFAVLINLLSIPGGLLATRALS